MEPVVTSGPSILTTQSVVTPVTPPMSSRPSSDIGPAQDEESVIIQDIKRHCLPGFRPADDSIKAFYVPADIFDEVEEFLSEQRLRYDYWFDSQRLVVRFPSLTHAVTTNHFAYRFGIHMQQQKKLDPGRFRCLQGTTIMSKIIGPQDGPDIYFVADMTMINKFNKPVVIIEASASQTKDNVTKKIRERLSLCPSLMGAIVIHFEEHPRYCRPDHDPVVANDTVSEDEWHALITDAPGLGPIIVRGNQWSGKMTCCFEVWLRGGDTDPIITQKQVIPDSSEGTAELDAALSELWCCVVRSVGGPQAQPIGFDADWDKFRMDIELSLECTALARYNTWIQPLKKGAGMRN